MERNSVIPFQMGQTERIFDWPPWNGTDLTLNSGSKQCAEVLTSILVVYSRKGGKANCRPPFLSKSTHSILILTMGSSMFKASRSARWFSPRLHEWGLGLTMCRPNQLARPIDLVQPSILSNCRDGRHQKVGTRVTFAASTVWLFSPEKGARRSGGLLKIY